MLNMITSQAIKRWIVIVGAVTIQICLGAIYAWSVFVHPLEEFGFTRTQTQAIFSINLAIFSIAMIFAGKWQDKVGPRIVAITGSIIFSLGYILVGVLGPFIHDTKLLFTLILTSVGFLSGIGMGIAYVCPLAAGIKWFPDKRGLITGIAVAGFGGGAWLFAKIASSCISSLGVLPTFTILGTIFLIATTLSSLILINPPKGWSPNGWSPKTQKIVSSQVDYTWQEMLKTSHFWLLWILFAFTATAGLMVIGHIKPFGIMSGVSPELAGTAVGILALFNATGRVVWGWISDLIGRKKSLVLMTSLQGIMMLVIAFVRIDAILLIMLAAWIGFNFGANFALFPSASADFFGTKNLGMNYGFLVTALGTAAIIGPMLGGYVFDTTGNYLYAFLSASILCLIAASLSLSWLLKSVRSTTKLNYEL